MKIKNDRHKGLKRLIETGSGAGLPNAVVDKVTKIVFFLQSMQSEEELSALPKWKPHQFTQGKREGLWSLHWRITFTIDSEQGEIHDMDYEDYH